MLQATWAAMVDVNSSLIYLPVAALLQLLVLLNLKSPLHLLVLLLLLLLLLLLANHLMKIQIDICCFYCFSYLLPSLSFYVRYSKTILKKDVVVSVSTKAGFYHSWRKQQRTYKLFHFHNSYCEYFLFVFVAHSPVPTDNPGKYRELCPFCVMIRYSNRLCCDNS